MNSSGPRIRPMTATDVDAVLVLAAGLKHAPQWPRAAYLAMLYAGAAQRRIALVCENETDGAVAGLIVASLTPPEAELESISVAAEYQRCGVARRLFETAARQLRNAEVTEVRLEVRPSNAAARGFYAALGFVEAGRRAGYYANPVEDALVLGRTLV
ncbi:MAG TPA: GNAT family N-acetyltransferase [Terracidiphilus sp.]|jgi:ribosomal-protein-alanine N-acetyltransferase|nr:GNAT family N-acetyltransferase [Terracidiphilus sp.]